MLQICTVSKLRSQNLNVNIYMKHQNNASIVLFLTGNS